jgi:dCMP deaminase
MIDKHKIYLKMAKDYALMSKCRKLKVGCMIVNNGRIVSTGVNGTPKGMCNCTDHFYNESDSEFLEKHREWSTENEVHAEMNALLYAAKTNVEVTPECILYCTHEPCNNCLKHIAVTGIKQIYYIEKYYGNTADCKYKIDIKQLSIEEPYVPKMVAYELVEPQPILTKGTSLDELFDISHIRGLYKLNNPIPIFINARSVLYEYDTIMLSELIEHEFGKVYKPEMYYADYRPDYTSTFIPISNKDQILLKPGMQFRCSGSTPGYKDSNGQYSSSNW